MWRGTCSKSRDWIAVVGLSIRLDCPLACGLRYMEQNKHLLSSKLAEILKRIHAQRAAELDGLEKAAFAEMFNEDDEYRILAGKDLDIAIEILAHVKRSAYA